MSASAPEEPIAGSPPRLCTLSPSASPSPSLSPPPSASPTPALSACPPLERSVSAASAASTTSTFSQRSSGSHASEVVINRRRGYARPQGTCFADSARNRESVMSLGSIAHVQHYFARTGLLDGKGGQMLIGRPRKLGRMSDVVSSGPASPALAPSSPSPSPSLSRATSDLESPYSSLRAPLAVAMPAPRRAFSEGFLGQASADGGFDDAVDEVKDAGMLPPTVSTYRERPKTVARPATLDELRNELRKTLQEARRILDGAAPVPEPEPEPNGSRHGPPDALAHLDSSEAASTVTSSESPSDPSQGWHQLQGLNILDTMTLAIRAAKMYYTAHEQPARLAEIRSERRLRQDLLGVLDVLKRMATRHFAGGLRAGEASVMQSWIDSVEDLLRQEEAIEASERHERHAWGWMAADWTGSARDRSWQLLRSFDVGLGLDPDPLPAWLDPSDTDPDPPDAERPTALLAALQSGLRLVRIHNEAVRKSRRPFGQITSFHTDTQKPYRQAENLRYWIKAAELRWDVALKIDVLGVVYNRGADVWRQFDAELLRWCVKVRLEMAEDWAMPIPRPVPVQEGTTSPSLCPPPPTSASTSTDNLQPPRDRLEVRKTRETAATALDGGEGSG
ncbi:MAG: hypothetical protein M1826_001005 [Phylliscum demangeonii]|nr:MAG: hypothetical protein M1826_001005 [Phylliscum demangeonii]